MLQSSKCPMTSTTALELSKREEINWKWQFRNTIHHAMNYEMVIVRLFTQSTLWSIVKRGTLCGRHCVWSLVRSFMASKDRNRPDRQTVSTTRIYASTEDDGEWFFLLLLHVCLHSAQLHDAHPFFLSVHSAEWKLFEFIVLCSSLTFYSRAWDFYAFPEIRIACSRWL